MIRRRVIVSGLVQGVYFRQTCKGVADENHICGSATNLENGNVEAVLEGDSDAVALVLDWLESGPPLARVDDVQVFEEEPRGETGFAVR